MFQENHFIQLVMVTIIIIMNITSYFLYCLDKKRAIKNRLRISEKTLLLITFLFGGMGAWIGMKQFRHKTKYMKFKLLVSIAAIITVGSFSLVIHSF